MSFLVLEGLYVSNKYVTWQQKMKVSFCADSVVRLLLHPTWKPKDTIRDAAFVLLLMDAEL